MTLGSKKSLGFDIILKKINVVGFPKDEDKSAILAAIKGAYKTSELVREMFDKWINTGKAIQINYSKGVFGAVNGGGILQIDLAYLKNFREEQVGWAMPTNHF